MPSVQAKALSDHVQRIFTAAGAPEPDATRVAEHLVEANLKGHDSHGVVMAAGYLRSIRDGLTIPGVEPVTEQETETTAVIDGGWNFGQIVARHAMSVAMRKARRAGVGIVVAHRSAHAGRIGAYVELATAEGLIGVAMANNHGASHLVAPFGGAEHRLSTNPMTFGFPTAEPGAPFVLDMATSMAAVGKVRIALNRGQRVPNGWLLDANGEPTNEPADFYEPSRGALLPLGGSAGHKGFGLSMVVEGLAGALSAAGVSRPNPPHTGNGLFMMAIDPERFGGLAAFATAFSGLIEWVKRPPFADGVDEVLTAGEPERRSQAEREANGIPLDDATGRQLAEAAADAGVAPLTP